MSALFSELPEQRKGAPRPEPARAPERVVGGYVLSSDIPVSTDQQPRQRSSWEKPEFPFAEMRVGESFRQDPLPGQHIIQCQNMVSGAASLFSRNNPHMKFTTRQHRGGWVRCWRIT